MRLKLFIISLLFGVAITSYTQDGAIDTSFKSGTGANNYIETSSVQSDGKIIIGGSFTSYNEANRNRIARLNASGSLDALFNPGTAFNNFVRTMTLQSDNRIIVGGSFTNFNGINRNHLVRLNTDGSLDTSFNIGTGASNDVLSTAIQSDGKILIAGSFTSYNGTKRNNIARLNANGRLDTLFNIGAGANYTVLSTALQSDEKILIAGHFTNYNGIARNHIARLNADGNLDTLFNPILGSDGTIKTLAIQQDGKIIIGGFFTKYNGIDRNNIARLNTNGSLDTLFDPGSGTNSQVATIIIQSDGRILIGGSFTSYNGTNRKNIARLNTNGSLDETFNPGAGANDNVRTIAIQSGSKIFIGGDFTSFDGASLNRLVRLFVCPNYYYSESDTICIGDTYTWHGEEYTLAGVYHDNLINIFGCDSIFQLKLSVNSIDVGVSLSGGTLSAKISADAYQWIECENDFTPISGATLQSYTVSKNGDYAVVIARGLCSDTSDCTHVITTEINSTIFDEVLAIFPNPFSDEIIFETKGAIAHIKFEIFNTIGQVVAHGNFDNNTIINTSGFAPGIYLVKLQKGLRFEVKKMIKR